MAFLNGEGGFPGDVDEAEALVTAGIGADAGGQGSSAVDKDAAEP